VGDKPTETEIMMASLLLSFYCGWIFIEPEIRERDGRKMVKFDEVCTSTIG
jgi:hypothetical protein